VDELTNEVDVDEWLNEVDVDEWFQWNMYVHHLNGCEYRYRCRRTWMNMYVYIFAYS